MGIPFISIFTIMETIPHNSSQSSYYNPLLSSIITFYMLILLYFPQFFLRIFFSPLLISTFILLLSLLRLGASQQHHQQQQSNISHGGSALALPQCLTQDDHNPIENQPSTEHDPKSKPEPKPDRVAVDSRQEVDVEGDVARSPCNTTQAHATLEPGPRPEPKDKSFDSKVIDQCLDWAEPEPVFSPKRLVEWDVGAPLEVIYEAYEGEGEGEDEGKNDAFLRDNEGCYNNQGGVSDKYPSLSRFYPDSDSDSDSGSESVSSISSWDGEYEDKEGLIEIALDCWFDDKKVHNNFTSKVANEEEEFCFDDEDNLIEIDIFPTKNMGDFSK